MSYREVYQNCKKDPEAFWLEAAGAIDWVKPPTRALFDEKEPFFTWFNDAVVNACWNALDRHVEAGRAKTPRSSTTAPSPEQNGRSRSPNSSAASLDWPGPWPRKGIERGSRHHLHADDSRSA